MAFIRLYVQITPFLHVFTQKGKKKAAIFDIER